MTPPSRDARARRLRLLTGWLALSLAAHLLVFLGLGGFDHAGELMPELPKEIELGLIAPKPGEAGAVGAAAPAAPPPPEPAHVKPHKRPPRPVQDDDGVFAHDAGVARAEPDEPERDAAVALGAEGGLDGGAPALANGTGSSLLGGGLGLGFGSGGFGNGPGGGGPPGAVIGLHADLERIGASSLVLETQALLALIPGWQDVLAGSGLDPSSDFARVFVATPNLDRGSLLVMARVRGGQRTAAGAVAKLAHERGQPAPFAQRDGVQVAPWLSRGPSQRVAAWLGADQLLIARPADVPRAALVAAALARRHAHQPGMERASGMAALLAMYEGEAVALSIEGVRAFAPAGTADYLPLGLRISLRRIDEYYAQLRLFGYFESAARAASAAERLEALRPVWAEHPRVKFLGLQSAVREAQLSTAGATLTVDAKVTLHQTRYLMHAVSRLLQPR